MRKSFDRRRMFSTGLRTIAPVVGAVIGMRQRQGRTVLAQGASPATDISVSTSDAPVQVSFPRDDGPHAAYIEWWYYTGHLFSETGDRYGFEFVVFKGERDGSVLGYASHFAVTDSARGTFNYDERLAPADGTATTVPDSHGTGFDLRVEDWRMWGSNGNDRLVAKMSDFAIALTLTPSKAPVLHDGDGYIDYGGGEATYYYSRTRLAVSGTLAVHGENLSVTGEAWMDHQWGTFTTFERGSWDWLSVQLDDRCDLMLYVIRSESGTLLAIDGSFVAADGTLSVLDADAFSFIPTGAWTSPGSGITYPSGWDVDVPGEELRLLVTPTISGQELDTRASTGVIYWEGEVTVQGERAGHQISGLGYVELTGYKVT